MAKLVLLRPPPTPKVSRGQTTARRRTTPGTSPHGTLSGALCNLAEARHAATCPASFEGSGIGSPADRSPSK